MQKSNFFYLFLALLLLLTAVPLVHDLGLAGTRFSIPLVFCLLLLVGIWSLRGGGRYYGVGIAFVLTGVVFNILTTMLDSSLLRYATLLSLTGFLLVAIVFSLRQIAFGTEIDANRLIGAVCVFLLIGVVWAFFYTLLELLVPGSFAGIAAVQETAWNSDWLYFSFVTLTTLGYGDVLPVSSVARTLAYMQAVAGQFYVAVLVAGLVSAYISQKRGG